jgi:ribonucleoside-diphosphate reductase alpha chain
VLDNVLDLTHWPLPEQALEAQSKRRIGVGFTGLGDALAMLNLSYNSEAGRVFASEIARVMRDTAYAASIELARERGSFPLLDVSAYLGGAGFASRLPDDIREGIARFGLRNSHLLSIAPTGTVSLAFADNASNGIEPAFSWTYTRKKREVDGSTREYMVQDHAWRVYRELGGDVNQLPPAFVTALEMSAQDHIAMMAAVQPYIDTAISKTVNVPVDCRFEDFAQLYMQAWAAHLKGLATYRPNSILGSVLQVTPLATEDNTTQGANSEAQAELDPYRCVIDRRPDG